MRFPSVRAHTLLVIIPSHSVRAYGRYFLKEIWQRGILWITINQMTTKNVIKKLTYKAISKYQFKHWRILLASKMRFFIERGWCKWKILAGCLFVLFLFCMELAEKKLMRAYPYILTSPLVRTSTRLTGPHTPLWA